MSSNSQPPDHIPPSSRPSSKRVVILAILGGVILFSIVLAVVGTLLLSTVGSLAYDSTASPTASISLTPTVWATFTHLPGDIYFLYQTQTAAAPTYPPIRWRTNTPITPTPLYTLTAAALASTKSSCLLAYPDFCVSPLQRVGCPNLPFHNFTVLAPDPYGYDPDHDGIGCEQ